MTESFDRSVLTYLKIDIQVSTPVMDEYLLQLIRAAEGFISREGVALDETEEDKQLVEMYAAYLYRHRREANTSMPRMLRWALNNRVITSRKGETADG